MRTIADHRVRFGELAGPLVHGAAFFDWALVSTQELAAAADYSFGEILADDGIPYAPVVAATSVERYPTIEDTVTVETNPRRVGDSSVELVYEMNTDDGERLATTRMTHVTIAAAGGALPLPERARETFAERVVERDPAIGPDADADADGRADLPTFSTSFRIRSPYIEGADLAYFEEYPRFADVALEEHLDARGTSLGELRGDAHPYRIRDWRWEFKAPVHFESTLRVDCDVLAVDEETIRVAHEFSSDGRTNIEGVTEYGCFDSSGAPTRFDDAMLAPFEGEA